MGKQIKTVSDAIEALNQGQTELLKGVLEQLEYLVTTKEKEIHSLKNEIDVDYDLVELMKMGILCAALFHLGRNL